MGSNSRPPVRQDSSFAQPWMDTSTLDAGSVDELFTRHNIAEVKAIKRQLRAEAESKQSELRHMVGERYRDLLQASTSIVSISQSSKLVMEILRGTKEVILSQEPPSPPRRTSLSGKENSHLQTLHLLSAHIKLLLDAPEHLWRLIEKKKFLSATWLFFLTRVVHRVLVSEDEQDAGSWSHQSIHVVKQFPLVQRQWDVITQFRSQIIQKTTAFLRECPATAEDVCAALLTLHLLDSRPLVETLSVLLAQRAKTVQAALSQTPTQRATQPSSYQNGQPSGTITSDIKSHGTFRRAAVLRVRQASQSVLEAISSTVMVSRDVFQPPDKSQRSMIGRALEHIQLDSPESLTSPPTQTSELCLTTQTLLTTLPSSAHFVLLPPNIKSYKPYVDLHSSSTIVDPQELIQRLNDWFETSSSGLKSAVERWFSELHSVREVWSVRASIRKWMHVTPNLTEEERRHMKTIFDDVCKGRIPAIWRLSLSRTETSFKERLDASIRDGTLDPSPSEFLYKPTALPVFTLPSSIPSPSVDSFLGKYRSNLKRQLNGRTPALHDVLSVLEECASSVKNDISEDLVGSEDPRTLVSQIIEIYRPDADMLCTGISTALSSTMELYQDRPEKLVFIARTSDYLAISSFPEDIHCSSAVIDNFRDQMKTVCDGAIHIWRENAVTRALAEYRDNSSPAPMPFSIDLSPSGPSHVLMNALFTLCTSIHDLGAVLVQKRRTQMASQLLRCFITSLLEATADTSTPYKSSLEPQILVDLTFLKQIAELWEEDSHWTDGLKLLNERIKQVRTECIDGVAADDVSDCSEYLSRTQILLETLLPSDLRFISDSQSNGKLVPLLHFGVPSSNQTQAALQVAKPSSRFGLLLIPPRVP